MLAINHFANPLDAPGGTRLIELSERLDGWDTTIVAAGRNLFTRELHGSEPGPHYRTVWTTPYEGNGSSRIINWMSFAVGAAAVGLRLDRSHRPHIVYASSPHLFTGLSGWLLARRYGVPFILEIRDLWPQVLVDTGRLDASSALYRWVKRLELFLYREADAVVALTEGVARYVAEEGVSRDRIHVIPNGADPDDFTTTGSRDELRQRYGFDGVTFVYAGAHGPANGLDFVLDAAAELAVDAPEARFVLVGDGISKASLRDRARREHLDRVTFLDPIPKNEIPDLLAAADVGLHVLDDLPLFLYGVSPNKLFDYMAAGLPVLTNTGGEVGELVKRNDAGCAVAPSDLATGARQLIRAGADERHALGANGRGFMAAHRSRTMMAGRLQRVLDALQPHEAKQHRLRLLAWQAWRRTVRTPWTVPLLPGRADSPVAILYRDASAAPAILQGDPSLRFVDSWVRAHPGTVVDLGAGIGTRTLVAAAGGASVLAFEPDTTAYLRLVENVDQNDMTDRVDAHHAKGTAFVRPDATISLVAVDANGDGPAVLERAEPAVRRDRPALLVTGDHHHRVDALIGELDYRVERDDEWIIAVPRDQRSTTSS